ncbi:MAG TPA: hypothetical protein VF487_04540 [Chitinophagaceae bacterium]
MKKIYLFLTLTTLSLSSFSQGGLKPFKVDVSVGYAIPGGTGSKGGVLFAVEPKYAVVNNIAVGLRMEAAVVARASGYNSSGETMNVDVKASGSYVATGDYYFSENYSFRPFAGIGGGLYSIAAASVSGSGTGTVGASSKFGGLIRAGIEVSHFRLGLEYNLIPKTTLDGYDSYGNPAKVDSKNSYIGIKVGVCFGGGPK